MGYRQENIRYKYSAHGMTEDELLFHANYAVEKKNSYFDSEIYGCGKYIRKYGFYPQYLPLKLHIDHGPNQWDFVIPDMLDSKSDYFGFYSQRLLNDFKTKSDKKGFVLMAPFAYYKRSQNIIKSPNVKGSLLFHAHSTFWTDKYTDISTITEVLNKLPDSFKPVHICMHFVDILKSRYKDYLNKNFPVFTAGNWLHPFFIENFYEILRHYNYALSNSYGSQLFYSVNLGIPFSILPKNEPVFLSNSDMNIIKSQTYFKDHQQIKKVYSMFEGLHLSISKEQQELVSRELGLADGVPRLTLAKYLYLSYLFYLIKFLLIKLLARATGGFKKIFSGLAKVLFRKTFQFELNIFTHLTFSEKYLLYRFASKLPPKSTCAEIGSYLGASSCFIAAGISADSKLYCIDTWGNQNMKYDGKDTDADERDTFSEFSANTKKYSNKIIKIRKWSTNAIDDLKGLGQNIDFLFIDGDHNYEGVKKDWDLYRPLLKKNSIVAFHDTGWAEGVKKVISEDVLHNAQLIEKLPNLQLLQIK